MSMPKASICGLIGINLDGNYLWQDTLLINSGVAVYDDTLYSSCQAFITIVMQKSLKTSDCRDIGDGFMIGAKTFIDQNYGARIERPNPHEIILKVTQECNEWLAICIQLLLLECNCALIHAAALEKDNEVILLPSWGGVGKTATVVKMIQSGGWRLLGDDLAVINGTHIAPYLKPFVIYPYHKDLFPNVFSKRKGTIITNLRISSFISRHIPFIKRLMRPIPRLLAFARKHNPQSMRVSPTDIFEPSQLSTGGELKTVIWLERVTTDDIIFNKSNCGHIASKASAISCMEIFSDRSNCIFSLIGADIFKYEDIYVRINEIYRNAFKACNCYELDIPVKIPIKAVGNIVLDSLSSIN